jgi:hypothetical protein
MRRAAAECRAGGTLVRAGRLLAAPVAALALAACALDGQPGISLVANRGATVAFESIDGPPQPVFQRLVENLAAEAVARQVSVISREASPQYRVRGYLAASIEGRRTHIGWVWDVYDTDKRRVLRIVGEEPGGRTSDAWGAADDVMLRRIARTGIDRLATFLTSGGTAKPPAGPPAAEDMTVAAAAADGARASALAAAMALADARP